MKPKLQVIEVFQENDTEKRKSKLQELLVKIIKDSESTAKK